MASTNQSNQQQQQQSSSKKIPSSYAEYMREEQIQKGVESLLSRVDRTKNTISVDFIGKLIQSHLAQGEFETPIRFVEKLVEQRPNQADLSNLLASLLMSDTIVRFEDAERHLKRALQFDQQQTSTTNNSSSSSQPSSSILFVIEQLSSALSAQGKHDEAIQVLHDAINRHQQHHRFHVVMGIRLIELEKYNEAINNLRKAIELQQNDGTAWCYLGYATYLAGQNQEALQLLRKSIELEPNNPLPFGFAHEVFFANIDPSSATSQEQINKATKEEEHFFTSLFTPFLDRDENDKASAVLQNALMINPENTTYTHMLESIRMKKN